MITDIFKPGCRKLCVFNMKGDYFVKVLLSALLLLLFAFEPSASGKKLSDPVLSKRMELYHKIEAVTQIPWYALAAVDQYEENVRSNRKDLPEKAGIISIYIPDDIWSGLKTRIRKTMRR